MHTTDIQMRRDNIIHNTGMFSGRGRKTLYPDEQTTVSISLRTVSTFANDSEEASSD